MLNDIKPQQLTFSQMLTYCNLPRSTAYHLLQVDSTFPRGSKFGRRRMFKVAELDGWLASKHGQEG